MREAVFKRDGLVCQLCGIPVVRMGIGTGRRDAAHLDHVIPYSKGGSDEEHNLRVACALCNWRRGNRDHEQEKS